MIKDYQRLWFPTSNFGWRLCASSSFVNQFCQRSQWCFGRSLLVPRLMKQLSCALSTSKAVILSDSRALSLLRSIRCDSTKMFESHEHHGFSSIFSEWGESWCQMLVILRDFPWIVFKFGLVSYNDPLLIIDSFRRYVYIDTGLTWHVIPTIDLRS